MAAGGWRMELFIQLTYAEKLQPTKTSFIDKRSVTKRFWLYLLEQKCPGGLYFCLCRLSLGRLAMDSFEEIYLST